MLGEETDESAEFSACVLSVVATLAGLSFAFVRQEVLDDRIDAYHATRLRSVRWFDHCFRDE